MTPRILVLITDRTNPPVNATRVRNSYLWTAVARQGVEVRVLGFDLEREHDLPPGPTGVESDFISHEPKNFFERLLNVTQYSFHQNPYSRDFADRVDGVLESWKPHIVHAEELRMAAYLPCVRGINYSGKETMAFHNVESDLLLKTGSFPYPYLDKIFNSIHHRNLEKFEKTVIESADLCFAYSQLDLNRYRKKYQSGTWALTEGGTNASNLTPSPQINDYSILLVGSLNYAPNIEGLNWFLHHVLPLLPKNTKITVAGSKASPKVKQRLANSPVRFIDTPETIDDLYRSHAISIVPLLSGSGTRGRILESLAHARAVVTTSKGVEGLDIAVGDGYILGDDPKKFAKRCNQLMENFKERRIIAELGRRRVLKRYDWNIVAKNLIEDWEKLLQGYFI